MASVQEKYKNYLIDAPEAGALSFEEFTGALASIGNKEAKTLKSLEKYEDIESSDKNVKDTRYVPGHPDHWKKKPERHGFIRNEEGKAEWGKLDEEDKFIFDKIEDKVEDKIEVEGGAALNDKIIPKKKSDKEKKGFSLSNFTEAVGRAFENIATELPGKMKEVWSDKDKRRNVLRGLEIINSSSGLTPLSQAKSPLGKISEGILKAESKFAAEDIAWHKALFPEKKILSAKERGITETFKLHAADFEKARNDYRAVDIRFNELYKLALAGKDPPTGILESAFSGLEKVLSEVGLLDEVNALIGRNQGKTEFSDEDLVTFKDIFTAATKRQIVGQVKELYPVSNKDIEILLQTVGDISTNPKALRALVAAEKAAKEINTIAFNLSGDIAFVGEGNFNFKAESQDAAAAQLAEKYKEQVKPETLITLYGTAENNTPFQIVNAYYHQQLEPVYKKMEDEGGYFEIFKAKEMEDTENILKVIEDRQEDKIKKK